MPIVSCFLTKISRLFHDFLAFSGLFLCTKRCFQLAASNRKGDNWVEKTISKKWLKKEMFGSPAHSYAFQAVPKTIVAKIGSASVTLPDGRPRHRLLNEFVRQLAYLRLRGNNVILVVSGAVAMGLRERGLKRSPEHSDLDKAYFASVGQPIMMDVFARKFKKHGLKSPGQLLLESIHFTMPDAMPRYNMRDCLMRSFADPGAIMVLNENDPASRIELEKMEEGDPNRIGDNDRLAFRVADLVGANWLVTVSTHSLYTMNPTMPGAMPIKFVNFADPENGLEGLGVSTEGVSSSGTGGMNSKIEANRLFVQGGRCGERTANIMAMPDVMRDGILRAYEGAVVGTLLVCARPEGLPKKAACPGRNNCLKAA